MKKLDTIRIVVNALPVRDYALVRLILGATKAGVHVDKKKARAKRACRQQVRRYEQ